MSKLMVPFLLIALITSACSAAVTATDDIVQTGVQGPKPVVTVFRPPT